jgi:hypothetical protein
MQLTIIPKHAYPLLDEFADQMAALSLIAYASEAANEMEFDSMDELQESVKRAMEICISAKIPLKGNFKRIYKSSVDGLMYDWKLSLLADRLVRISGKSSNPNVAHLTIELIRNEHINHF